MGNVTPAAAAAIARARAIPIKTSADAFLEVAAALDRLTTVYLDALGLVRGAPVTHPRLAGLVDQALAKSQCEDLAEIGETVARYVAWLEREADAVPTGPSDALGANAILAAQHVLAPARTLKSVLHICRAYPAAAVARARLVAPEVRR